LHLRNCAVAIALACTVLSPVHGWGAEPATETMAATPATAASRTLLLSPIDAAKLAITIGDYAKAGEILSGVLAKYPSSTEALFLMGEMNRRQHKYAEAIPYYRKILVDHPDIVRVRLDLARALFETKEDDQAEYNFHLALAEGSLPNTVIDNVERYLAIIRSRQHFVWDLNFGLAPDTNINAAAAADHVTIFGLPFQLSQQARQQSGVGVTSTIDGEYRYDLTSDIRWRTGALLYRLEYPGNTIFDDMTARVYGGPQWLFKDGDISVLGVGSERWYGDHPYSVSGGGRLEGQYWLTKQFLWSSYLEGLSATYHQDFSFLDGYYLDHANYLSYYLDPTSFVRGTVGAGYQKTAESAFTNWYDRLGLAYQREFVWGITANVAPEVRWWYYQGADPFFGVRRQDRQYFVSLSVYKRDFTIFGFSPVFTYSYTTNQSNDPLFKYNRNQFQIGVTRQF
jgi:tetratricopeptide (TPR) repeat protein